MKLVIDCNGNGEIGLNNDCCNLTGDDDTTGSINGLNSISLFSLIKNPRSLKNNVNETIALFKLMLSCCSFSLK